MLFTDVALASSPGRALSYDYGCQLEDGDKRQTRTAGAAVRVCVDTESHSQREKTQQHVQAKATASLIAKVGSKRHPHRLKK